MLLQNFGVMKEHYGMLWYFLEWSIKDLICKQTFSLFYLNSVY